MLTRGSSVNPLASSFLELVWDAMTYVCDVIKDMVCLSTKVFDELRWSCIIPVWNISAESNVLGEIHAFLCASKQLACTGKLKNYFTQARNIFQCHVPTWWHIMHFCSSFLTACPPAIESVPLNPLALLLSINALATNGNHLHGCSWCCSLNALIMFVSVIHDL